MILASITALLLAQAPPTRRWRTRAENSREMEALSAELKSLDPARWAALGDKTTEVQLRDLNEAPRAEDKLGTGTVALRRAAAIVRTSVINAPTHGSCYPVPIIYDRNSVDPRGYVCDFVRQSADGNASAIRVLTIEVSYDGRTLTDLFVLIPRKASSRVRPRG